MRTLPPHPSLVDQVYEAILSEIAEGNFAPEGRLMEDLAQSLGVSRQPVQQAPLLLRTQGSCVRRRGAG